jgi:hypothetical protein
MKCVFLAPCRITMQPVSPNSLEHLQQIPNTTPHPHKTELLGEIDQFSYSNSTPILPPIFGGHQKNTHLPSNKGALATSPNHLFFWRKHTHW